MSFFLCNAMFAQEGIISGRLQDGQQETIPFATVSVLRLPDSTIVTGTTTDLEGKFELKPKFTGEVLLRFTAIGYSEVFTPAFNVSGPAYIRDVGTHILREEVTMLNEVMLSTWKPRIKAESGKMVMSIENTAMAAGSTAYEVLSRAPGVAIDQSGGFSINGKQGVAVMLDGRLTYLSSDDLKSLLESMPAENIKEIEVIHNPSAKYDAEGIAGILNIKLKSNSLNGLSGSAYGGFKYSQQQLFNGGVNLNYSSGKWNSFFNVDVSERGFYREPTIIREYPEGGAFSIYKQSGVQEIERLVPSLHLGTDYELTPGHTVGAMANFSYEDMASNWNTENNFFDPEGKEALFVSSKNSSDRTFSNGRFNLHYSGKLDTIGTSLSADLDYVRLDKDDKSRFVNQYSKDDLGETGYLSNVSLSDYEIYAGKMDAHLPLSTSSNLDMGVKASRVTMDSELRSFEGQGNNRVFDPQASDHFTYEEEIIAIYASYNNRFNNTWDLQAGLRVEQTNSEGRSISLDQTTPLEYLELFPNLQVEQRVSENYKISYAFSRRISRPDYHRLNPSIFYLDPYTAVVGNPYLKPQINTSLQLSQNLFKKYNLMLSYDFADRFIVEVPSVDTQTGQTTIIVQNINHSEGYNATLNFPVEPFSFWNSNNNLILSHQAYELDINEQEFINESTFFMLQSNHQVNLPAKFKLEVNGTYRSRSAFGLAQVEPMWWIDAGVKRSFMNGKLDVTLRADDIFRSRELTITEDYFGNRMELNQYLDYQALSINLRYSFIKGKSKQETRSKTLEEMNRAGG